MIDKISLSTYLTAIDRIVQDEIHMPNIMSSASQAYRVILIGAVLILAAVTLGAFTTRPVGAATCPELLQHTFPSLQDGTPHSLCQYQGKVILVVNTASYCGFTDQYGGLEALYRKYRAHGLVVLGFPSNDFGNQEPGDSKQIAKFCRRTYNVEFPMLEKSHVAGSQRTPFYAELARRSGQTPKWNFHKYLIDRSGSQVQGFESAVAPDDKQFPAALHKMLDARKSLIRKT
jgi:glutathione peroxidase